MSSRPRRLVVGEEALVRRRRRWGRASALVVAEHAAALLWGGACYMGSGACGRRGQPFLPASGLLDERCDVQTLRPGRGARVRCAPGAPCSCPGWAGSVRPGRHGRSGDVSRGFDDSCGRSSRLVPGPPTCGCLVASTDSAWAVELNLALGGGKSARGFKRTRLRRLQTPDSAARGS